MSVIKMSCFLTYIPVTPLISDISSLTEVHLGMPAVLVCLVTGYPLPSIVWRKDGEDFIDDSTLHPRLDIIEFSTENIRSNNGDILAIGYMGNSSIAGLLTKHTSFTVDQVLQLGELGVVGLLSFEETVRGDTANYTCTATNSLPETTTVITVSDSLPLVVLGKKTNKLYALHK